MISKFFRISVGANVRRFLASLGMTMFLLCPAALSAQNGVTVSGLSVDAGTLMFDVSWNRDNMPPIAWSDTVWVFVDYNDAGTMRRLPLESGATLTTTSAPGVGQVEQLSNNNKGVRVIGNARSAGSFSATVKLLTATAAASGVCVYASNYPPEGIFVTDSDISFTGTPMYNLTFDYEGNIFTLPSGGTYLLPAGYTLLSFVDATDAPGMIIPTTSSLTAGQTTICRGASVTLTAVAVGAASYSFDNGTTWQATATLTESPTSTKSYTLKVKSVTGHVSRDSKTATVTVNALPTVPTDASSNARCGSGTVTFSATAPSSCTIDWYTASSMGSIVSGGNGVTSFSPLLTAATITYYAQSRNTFTNCVSTSRLAVTGTANELLAAPVVNATLCFGLPGKLQATAPSNATVTWYDAPTGGNLLYTGNALPLTPLYNNTTQYYAEARVENNCVSARIMSNYTVNNCMINGYCPGFTPGSVVSAITPAACGSFYSGQIGAAGYPAACVSYSAGWIGNAK
jgi:hypothetical protein